MDFFKPRATYKGKEPESVFHDSTLVLPIVSLANVAQLSADLLIHSLKLQRIGCLSARYHVPVVGPADYVEMDSSAAGTSTSIRANGSLSTAIEVFQSKDGSLTLVQQRSPVIKSEKDAFVHALSSFIFAANFKRVLLVAGTDTSLRQDFDNPSPFRSLSTSSSSLKQTLAGIMPTLDGVSSLATATTDSFSLKLPLMPSSGITRRLLASLMGTRSTPSPQIQSTDLEVSAILMYVAEGDNRYDSHLLARCIDRTLGLQTPDESWVEPVSWKVGLYGKDVHSGRQGILEGSELAAIYG